MVPTLLLVYRQNFIQSLNGLPNDQEFDNLIQTVCYYSRMANEEKLVLTLIEQASECMLQEKYNEAISLYKEAKSIKQWNGVYGAQILVNLAYSYA